MSNKIKTKYGTAILDKKGYYTISSRKEGNHHKRLHRLIWEENNGKIPNGYVIHHINGISTDNNLSNLQLMSKKEHDLLHKNSEETKKKISESLKGRKHSKQTKEKISKSHIGITHSKETKQKLREINLGKKLSEDTKRKIGNKHKGKKLSDESKYKLSKLKNTTGYFRVTKRKDKRLPQGFYYMYVYYEDNKKKTINSVDLKKLEKRVKEKGLKWIEIN